MVRKKTHSRDQAADKSPRSGFHEALWTSCLILVYNLKFPQCNECNVYKTGDIFSLELGSIPLVVCTPPTMDPSTWPWTRHDSFSRTWHAISLNHVCALQNILLYLYLTGCSYGSLQGLKKCTLSFFKFRERCSYSLYSRCSIVSWSFSSKGWRISWHFQMQRNQANFPDIHIFLALESEVPPPLPLPTLSLSHRHHHYQPPLSPPPLSQPPRSQPPPLTKTCFAHLRNASFEVSTFSTFSFWGKSCTKKLFSYLQLSVFFFPGKSRTKTSFSHCPCSAFKIVSHENFVFTSPTFSSSNYFRKRVSPAEKRVPRKTFFERTNRPAFGRRELCYFFDYRLVIVRVIVWDTWLDQKKICNTMILGNPFFSKLLKMSWTKFEAAVENKKHKPKGIQEKSGIKSTCCKASHCAFLSPAWTRCH